MKYIDTDVERFYRAPTDLATWPDHLLQEAESGVNTWRDVCLECDGQEPTWARELAHALRAAREEGQDEPGQ